MTVTLPDSGVAERVDALFAKWHTSADPGCALGIVQEGELVHEGYFGMADLEHDIAHSPASVFDIASTSKQFTAAAALILDRSGQLSLDDPVQGYVPELPDYASAITLRHLVHHTSGIRDYIALRHLAGWRDGDHLDMQDVLDLLAAQRDLDFDPGSKHRYSNSGYVLLAIIVSRVTGKSFPEWCSERLLEPLGMAASGFREDSGAVVPGLVQSYTRRSDGRLLKTIENEEVYGDGGLLTTLRDLARWERNFLSEEVGGPGFMRAMSTPGTPEGVDERYAFGLQVGEHRGRRTVSHGGNLRGYSGDFIRFPDERLAVMCLANIGGFDAGGLARQVADVVLGSESARTANRIVPAAAEPLDAATVCGHYVVEDAGILIRVTVADSGLRAEVGDQTLELRPGPGGYSAEYQDVTLDIRFEPGDGESPDRLRFLLTGDSLLTAVRVQPPPADSILLGEYTGRYQSSELATYASIVQDDTALYLQRGRAPRERLTPVRPDEFSLSFGSVRFTRDAGGEIDGFVFGMSRAGGVLFRSERS